MKLLTGILVAGLFAQAAFAQTTPEQAIEAALKNNPLVKAAVFETQAKRYAQKAAFNLPNPELNAESPTGEFYAVGIQQAFEFPTVYIRQKQVAKAETTLAETGQRMQENELKLTVRSLYLEAQVAEYQYRQWAERDSLFRVIQTAAIRQFDAGEIDFLQKNLLENEAGKVHQEYLSARQYAATTRQNLGTYTGLNEPGGLIPLQADTAAWMVAGEPGTNPSVSYDLQAAQVASRQIDLAKSRALPAFSLGYLNQGVRSTPIDYRFKVSVSVPLWAGQYQAGIHAAKAEGQAATARAEARQQAVDIELQRTRSEMDDRLRRLRYFQSEALPRSRALISGALRMREAGQTDYITFLRTLDEAFSIQRDYATQLQAFQTARIQIMYLSGL